MDNKELRCREKVNEDRRRGIEARLIMRSEGTKEEKGKERILKGRKEIRREPKKAGGRESGRNKRKRHEGRERTEERDAEGKERSKGGTEGNKEEGRTK